MASVKSTQEKAAKTVEDAAANLDKLSNGAGETLRDNMEKAMGAAADLSAFGRGNLDAWVASTTATQKGIEALSARAAAFSRQALQNHVSATRSVLASKSLQEAMEKQTDYARAAFDSYIAELTMMSDLMSGLARDALKPLNERVSAVSTIMQNGRLN